jgi:hypothetical protein
MWKRGDCGQCKGTRNDAVMPQKEREEQGNTRRSKICTKSNGIELGVVTN